MSEVLRIALAQLKPAWLDPRGGVRQIIAALEEAHREGAQLCAFGETFLGGYPFWLSAGGGARFEDADQKAAFARYLQAAVPAEGPEMEEIVAASRDLGLFTWLGFAERGPGPASGSVFCSLAAICPEEGLLSVHRKLMPTFEERLVWAAGDGAGLRTHRYRGWRLSGLNCWENWMPQARHALYADGTELHVAVWPGGSRLTRDITRFAAMEGRIFVASVGALLGPELLPSDWPERATIAAAPDAGYDGGSAVAAPDGHWLLEPQVGGEGVHCVTLERSRVLEARQSFDPTGHYSRPDVFDVAVDRRRRLAARFRD